MMITNRIRQIILVTGLAGLIGEATAQNIIAKNQSKKKKPTAPAKFVAKPDISFFIPFL